MSTGSLVIPGFGGGVVKASSAEAMQTNELQQADGCDIGDREQLISAALASLYTYIDAEGGSTHPIDTLYGMFSLDTNDPQVIVVGGHAIALPGVSTLIRARFDAASEPAQVPNAKVDVTAVGYDGHGSLATFASFPYVKAGVQIRPLLVAVCVRLPFRPFESTVESTMVLVVDGAGAYSWHKLNEYDALGTGNIGEFAGGTKAKILQFRCIEAYNNHVFGAGCDVSVATRDAPNRLMFSNLGNPLKWGNDDQAAAGVDRDFSDTDAIVIGGAGESILALKASRGMLWIGTNRGLHYLQGFGRDSFKTDGTTGIAKSLDVVGPHALEEGPDGILYGVSARGLWAYSGEVVHLYQRLVDPNGHSNGFWDLMWFDAAALDTDFPGKTNQDFVWLLSVPELDQLWVVIPYCDSVAGFGKGNDTVVIKYHTKTGGFTRQVFTGVAFVHGVVIKRSAKAPDTILFVNAPIVPGTSTIFRYRYRATPTAIPASAPMSLVFGAYAPFGPNGRGVNRVVYFTVSWEDAASLPVTVALAMFIDQQQVDAMTLTIGGAAAPVGPANGDVWLDTRGTDTNLGNAVAGAIVPLSNDYLLFRWVSSWNKWVQIPRAQGMKGTRATIPVAYIATPGTRVKITAAFTSAGRVTVESLGLGPQDGSRTAQ